LPSPATWFAGP